MDGWIKLHRKIRYHWIWKEPQKLQWWLDLMLMANYKESKTLQGDTILLVGTGELLTTETELSERWGVSRGTVKRFLNLLVDDDMISVSSNRKNGTTLKLNNYNAYQLLSEGQTDNRRYNRRTTNEQQTDNQRDNYIKKEKNIKKDKKKERVPAPVKNAYGEFLKVRLTDEEHHELVKIYGSEKTANYIQRLDLRLAKYRRQDDTDHFVEIKQMIYLDEQEEKENKNKPQPVNRNRFANFKQREWDEDQLKQLETLYLTEN